MSCPRKPSPKQKLTIEYNNELESTLDVDLINFLTEHSYKLLSIENIDNQIKICFERKL